MGDFGRLGFAPEGFEPIGGAEAAVSRTWLATQLRDDSTLDGWEVYDEPPEQLAGRACIVIAPRSPYQSWGTYRTIDTHLTVSLLVPRTHGPAMDRIDAGLARVRTVLMALTGVSIGTLASVGILEDVGAVSYVVAAVDVDIVDVPA